MADRGEERDCEAAYAGAIVVEVVWQHCDGGPSGEACYAIDAPGIAAASLRRRLLRVASPATLAALLGDSRLADLAVHLRSGRWAAAIFGRTARPDTRLHDGDRIELLGPVTADPKLARRHRVARERAGGDKWRRRGARPGPERA